MDNLENFSLRIWQLSPHVKTGIGQEMTKIFLSKDCASTEYVQDSPEEFLTGLLAQSLRAKTSETFRS